MTKKVKIKGIKKTVSDIKKITSSGQYYTVRFDTINNEMWAVWFDDSYEKIIACKEYECDGVIDLNGEITDLYYGKDFGSISMKLLEEAAKKKININAKGSAGKYRRGTRTYKEVLERTGRGLVCAYVRENSDSEYKEKIQYELREKGINLDNAQVAEYEIDHKEGEMPRVYITLTL